MSPAQRSDDELTDDQLVILRHAVKHEGVSPSGMADLLSDLNPDRDVSKQAAYDRLQRLVAAGWLEHIPWGRPAYLPTEAAEELFPELADNEENES